MEFLDKIPKSPEQWAFIVLALITVFAAFEVVVQRNPLTSAIALIFSFLGLAGIYVTLNAQFLAVIQVIVYAGAIIVLFVFVIMLLNVRAEESKVDKLFVARWAALLSVGALLLTVFSIVADEKAKDKLTSEMARTSASVGTVESIGRELFTEYLLPFEATSLLIMMAIVGSLVLAQQRQQPETVEEPSEPASAEPEKPVREVEVS
jgi:NADH-quinone oxidoreductase subunit J